MTYAYELLLVSDDLRHPSGELPVLRMFQEQGIPISPSVLIDEARQDTLGHSDRRTLQRLQAGVHVNLFSREAKHTSPILGPEGNLYQTLHKIEEHKNNPVLFSAYNLYGSMLVRHGKTLVESEITRQAQAMKDLTGGTNGWMTYHYGLHYFHALYQVFAETAHKLSVPHRHAPQYYPRKDHVGITTDFFVDQCNNQPTSGSKMGELLRQIKLVNSTTEMCLHLWDGDYGASQVVALQELARLSWLQRNFKLIQPADLARS